MSTSENPERENRILDAAADLFIHYGYDKTTVSDIAKSAGVSKGAIYLHFSSKDDLFEALLVRETTKYQAKWLELLENDPNGGTIGGMYKNILHAFNISPFMTALFRKDQRILGNYLRKPNNLYSRMDSGARFQFVTMMQEAGAMRRDADPKVVSHIMNMLAFGLVAMDDYMDPEYWPEFDDLINGIADMMDRAFTPPGEEANEAGLAVLHQISAAARAQYEKARGSRAEKE